MSGLIIHHWDTDGICSAVILLEILSSNLDNYTPYIGNYYLTDEEISSIKEKKYKFIIIADMALPKDNILKLKYETKANIQIFDHHIQEIIDEVEHYNPVSLGRPSEKYPSATWVINKYFKQEINLLSILGAVGDNENKIKNNKEIYSKIKKYLSGSGFSFDHLLKIVNLLDSNYKMGNKEKVIQAVRFILANYSSPELILEHIDWNQNLIDIKREIDLQCNKTVNISNNTVYQKIDTTFNIISSITRRLAWENEIK